MLALIELLVLDLLHFKHCITAWHAVHQNTKHDPNESTPKERARRRTGSDQRAHDGTRCGVKRSKTKSHARKQREAARFIQKCDCSDPVGPLKDVCRTDGMN